MSDTSPFSSVDIPFISSGDGKRVDWIDVGLWSLGVVFATLVRYAAETVAALWDLPVIEGLHPLTAAYTVVVGAMVLAVIAGLLIARAAGVI